MLTDALYAPTDHADMMSYCSPILLSDYTFRAMFVRISAVNGTPVMTAIPERWRVLLSDAEGLRWGQPVTLRAPADGAPRRVTFLDAAGVALAEVDGYAVPLSHLHGSTILIPEPPARAVSVLVEGAGRLRL